MKRLSIVITLVIMTASSTMLVVGGAQKPRRGVLENETLLAYASTSGEGGNSGRIWSAEGRVEGLGKVDVLVSARPKTGVFRTVIC